MWLLLTEALAEMHFKKQAMHDPNPSSAFSPLPPAFNLGRKNKEQARAGQRAEVNHMLEPEFQSSSRQSQDDSASMAGPSRLSAARTAGGLAALTRKKGRGDEPRPSDSVTSFHGQQAAPRRGKPGVYVDSGGRTHDTEFDPFAGVAALSRRKSKQRRSAFGPRRNSSSSGSSDGSSEGQGHTRRAPMDRQGQETEREYRRRLEAERRQLDDVSGYAAARRQSLMSDRASGFYSGRGTPSVRSGRDDALSLAHLAPNGRAHSRISQNHLPSPISPTFDKSSDVSASVSAHTAPSYPAGSSAGNEESPRKHTEKTGEPSEAAKIAAKTPRAPSSALENNRLKPGNGHQRSVSQPVRPPPVESSDEEEEADPPPEYEAPPVPKKTLPELHPVPRAKKTAEVAHSISVLPKTTVTKPPKASRTERSASGATRVTGFDAGPTRPLPPQSVPAASRLRAESVMTTTSSRSSEAPTESAPRHRRPKERPREQLFPETPAQAKRREERERRNLRAGKTPIGTFAADSVLPGTSSRTRILPEIKFVDDDDPRIVFPPNGASTRIQHPRSINTIQSDLRHSFDSSIRQGSIHSAGRSSKEPSAIIEESGGGYLPSRWASGDRQLRVDVTEKEMYRPKEWGGRKGDLGGRPDEWHPTVKDEVKRELKDLTVNARFSLFRAKKKISRKTDL